MSDAQKGDSSGPSPASAKKPSPEESDALRRVEREADEMAEEARDSEKKYDAEHDIFTK